MSATEILDRDAWVLETEYSTIALEKWQKTVDIMARIFQAPAGFIVQFTSRGYQVVISSRQESNPYAAGGIIAADTNIFCRKVLADMKGFYVQHASGDPAWADNPEVADDGFNSYYGLPIKWPGGKPFGTMCVMDYRITDYAADYLELMEQFKDLIEKDLEIVLRYMETKEMSLRDDLTGLYNRRGFRELVHNNLACAKYRGRRYALIFFDLDEFKAINDIYGHDTGDLVLKQFGQALTSCLRKVDLVARLGGDEFAALVLLEGEVDVEAVSRRIGSVFAEGLRARWVPAREIAFSVGHALYDVDGTTDMDTLLAIADGRMYQEKRKRFAAVSG
jgi:diguanylate cyclase (GGDEF)-like protein